LPVVSRFAAPAFLAFDAGAEAAFLLSLVFRMPLLHGGAHAADGVAQILHAVADRTGHRFINH
jgi:hypothetical protein